MISCRERGGKRGKLAMMQFLPISTPVPIWAASITQEGPIVT